MLVHATYPLLLCLIITVASPAAISADDESVVDAAPSISLSEQDSQYRSLYSIVYSCLLTLGYCIWTALHPNIPASTDGKLVRIGRRIKLMVSALVMPEMIALWATLQSIGATRLAETDEFKERGWVTTTHGFFAQMGGFMLHDADGVELNIIWPKDIGDMLRSALIDTPRLKEEEIKDRSKSDFFSKTFALCQTTYFLAQCAVRWKHLLPLTELEVMTFTYTIMNIYVYCMWWRKPQNVDHSFSVCEKRRHGGGPWVAVSTTQSAYESNESQNWTTKLWKGIKMVINAPFYGFGAWWVEEDDTGLYCMAVPPFYSYELEHHPSQVLLIATALISTAYGAIHYIAWTIISIDFPTHFEEIIWRLSAMAMTTIPSALVVCLFLSRFKFTQPLDNIIAIVMTNAEMCQTRATQRLLQPHPESGHGENEVAMVTCVQKQWDRYFNEALEQVPDCDLEELLRRRVLDPKDDTAITDLKNMKKLKRDEDIIYVAQNIIDKIKLSVSDDIREEGKKTLEVELYLEWLKGFDFVLKGVEAVLNAKVPGTRRRITGVGRLSFSLLYHCIEVFIDEVNAHQDGWSFRHPVGPVEPDPLIMTLSEECNDSTSDTRSEEAVHAAEQFLERYDKVMVQALQRYKSECNRKLMASAIERKEESLSRGCCLLSEQTGYGGTEDMGFKLLVDTRDAMTEWKLEG
ncbi:hypothetical protein H0H92_004423 [Tricholoma furcatifolium]|nr:hypothetical protein H0H92_004423 [Tricholoma furcatifolium]